MTNLKNTINVIIDAGETQGYVAECLEISVVSQGLTLDETIKNIQEAVSLHLEDEDLTEFGLTEKPSLKIN
ncbi:MAG: type II toxin-antitoxin system HicB family antitoxin [Cyanobacteria bacterium]|nr:type II toxin-antitoxin system HicB family antitoxin [Cyanobacteria bacterium CG_2015-16_32_12]NCO77277.1 type II toxin-antitoxin system HicB family antitoxin [Cyanobacteria bacterium CG_2015-22_32_23]NCQ05439.1 type II toxin-antitoxin system HicB family antitoxin [Cyanobacteria bacterium CG_2015-09_32_10]NCQ42709.1 type II toxin-antitoxin system HicB family antitoxin [Cyanobacteria bacterium CG_2015-04_32_10]NCS85101.1 type II toxin-antitoxin system HicB family antitoxin [Cyanobacteria bact